MKYSFKVNPRCADCEITVWFVEMKNVVDGDEGCSAWDEVYSRLRYRLWFVMMQVVEAGIEGC